MILNNKTSPIIYHQKYFKMLSFIMLSHFERSPCSNVWRNPWANIRNSDREWLKIPPRTFNDVMYCVSKGTSHVFCIYIERSNYTTNVHVTLNSTQTFEPWVPNIRHVANQLILILYNFSLINTTPTYVFPSPISLHAPCSPHFLSGREREKWDFRIIHSHQGNPWYLTYLSCWYCIYMSFVFLQILNT
jgi:hypothetical protein